MDASRHHELQVGRFYDEIWNRPDTTVIPEVLAPDVTFRGSLGDVRTGHAEFADYVRTVTGALADYRCDIVSLVASGDQVAARMMFSGVHRAPFLGFAPTGRRVSWAGAAFFTFGGGLVGDLWVLGDLHGLRGQLEA
ncbi:ester cyclase [Pseudonocardia acaciae]|uniref:ester cyclase n=1 Tax=Pseudonocardia acaciae TaxID=551276 RepID=UPI00048BAD75|nr:ester cyclase [Pseudonocardia acaciae]